MKNANFQTYSPLSASQIRLLTLYPDQPGTTIECDLVAVSITSPPKYAALSYRWGDAGQKSIIKLNQTEFSVTQNLYEALLQFRSETEPRVLWIDAICINQMDIKERNSQVEQMGQIYSQAQSTFVWLGIQSDNSDLAMDLINSLAYPQVSWHIMQRSITSAVDAVKWAAIELLWFRPYWKRIWIIQEIVLAKDVIVYCGSKSVQWHHLVAFINCLMTVGCRPNSIVHRIIQGPASVLIHLTMKWTGETNKVPLDLLMFLCTEFQCTDQRDMVYGLLGLAQNVSNGGIQVDYSKSMYQIYRDTLKFLGKNDPRNDNLVCYSRLAQTVLKSPSADISISKPRIRDKLSSFFTHKSSITKRSTAFDSWETTGFSPDMEIRSSPAWSDTSQASRVIVQQWKYLLGYDYESRDIQTGAILRNMLALTEDTKNISYINNHAEANNASQSSRTEEQNNLWTFFSTRDVSKAKSKIEGSWIGGVAPAGLEPGDRVCMFPKTDVGAIIRLKGTRFEVVARAAFCMMSEGTPSANKPQEDEYGMEDNWSQFPAISLKLDEVVLQVLTKASK